MTFAKFQNYISKKDFWQYFKFYPHVNMAVSGNESMFQHQFLINLFEIKLQTSQNFVNSNKLINIELIIDLTLECN